MGERIKQARLEAGLRQEDLAVACGVSNRTVNYWESGDLVDPPYLHLRKLEEVLGRSKEWLLFGDDASPSSGDGAAPRESSSGDSAAPREWSLVYGRLRALEARLAAVEARLSAIEGGGP